jgi:hypothetical protein
MSISVSVLYRIGFIGLAFRNTDIYRMGFLKYRYISVCRNKTDTQPYIGLSPPLFFYTVTYRTVVQWIIGYSDKTPLVKCLSPVLDYRGVLTKPVITKEVPPKQCTPPKLYLRGPIVILCQKNAD